MPDPSSSDTELQALTRKQNTKSLLRFITCGSVDDGKSTLIGRLLYDAKVLHQDQLEVLQKDSRNCNAGSENIDFAMLVDGLAAEREQGITIDVAYRYFSTSNRKFIVADTPGHEQYTRNMVTGASTADLAILLIDARQGLLTQTRRHAFILSLIGIKHVVLVVNKIDLMDYNEQVFIDIKQQFGKFASELDFSSIDAIPVSALCGDNIITNSPNMPWYSAEALLPFLENIEIEDRSSDLFRFPVQWVCRPDLNFRGFAGTVASGVVKVGDEVMVTASLKRSKIARIVTFDGDVPIAEAGDAVTLTLNDEIDISRGDVLTHIGQPQDHGDQFQARMIWMSQEPALVGRSYLLKIGEQTTPAQITDLKYTINVNSHEHVAATHLEMNALGVCNFATARQITFDPYDQNAVTGSFILIDRISNATVGAGMINYGLFRSQNIFWQSFEVNRETRSELKNQTPAILWFTGLSGSGKSAIANAVEKKMLADGYHTYLLDGDNIRHGLNKDLGFTNADRVENIRRIAEVARLMADSGLIVLVSFISPFELERKMAREVADDIDFYEIFVDTPIEVCEERDVKGLYAKARAGELKNFTGISSAYEAPIHADLHLDGANATPEELAKIVTEIISWQR